MNKKISKGSALIIAIMISIILFILIGGSIAIIDTSTNQVASKIEEIDNYWTLESALNFAVKKLRNLEKNNTHPIGVFDVRPLYKTTSFKDHYNSSYSAVGCAGKNQVDYLEAFRVVESPSTWEIIAKIKKKDGSFSVMKIENIQTDSPFRYCLSDYAYIKTATPGQIYLGPSYFAKGLMTTSWKNKYSDKIEHPVFRGPVYSGYHEYDTDGLSLAINESSLNQNIINGSSLNEGIHESPLKYSGYGSYEVDGVNYEKRQNWFRAGKPVPDKLGNLLDFSDYYYGLVDSEKEDKDCSLTDETPKETLDRLQDTYREGYFGGSQEISIGNILEKKFDDIMNDPTVFGVKFDNPGIGKHPNIGIHFKGDKVDFYWRENTDDDAEWFPYDDSDIAIGSRKGIAFDEGYENIAVMGDISQDLTIVTHSADVEIYDDIAPTSVYNALVDKIDSELYDEKISDENIGQTKAELTALMDSDNRNAKIALIAGIEKKADIIVALRNASKKGRPGTADEETVAPWASDTQAMVIGAALFAPNGNFGMQIDKVKNMFPVLLLGGVSTGGLKDIKYRVDVRRDPKNWNHCAGIRPLFMSDPKYLRGETPPLTSKALVKDKDTGLLEINFNNNYKWSYVK